MSRLKPSTQSLSSKNCDAERRGSGFSLGLVIGTIDLFPTVYDVYFLQVNTLGAYIWLGQALDLPITGALCDQLLS